MISASVGKVRKKLLGALCIVLALIVAAILFFGAERPQKAAEAVSLHASDNKARTEYISSKGLRTAGEPSSVKEIILPEEFDSVLSEYNDFLKSCGFDLLPYRGKTVTVYEYPLLGREEAFVTLYVSGDKIIAGDISLNAEGKKLAIDGKDDLG